MQHATTKLYTYIYYKTIYTTCNYKAIYYIYYKTIYTTCNYKAIYYIYYKTIYTTRNYKTIYTTCSCLNICNQNKFVIGCNKETKAYLVLCLSLGEEAAAEG